MEITQVLKILSNPGNAMIKPGLERMMKIMQRLENPQFNYKVIHITGSNGKGSTATFIETGLIAEGFKVGKYSSPFIKNIHETISLNGQSISDEELINAFLPINSYNEKYQLGLSPFELLTALMFNYFAKKQIDYLVLEVGMGGKNDATNVVNPLVSIITNISLEHTNYLGNTLELIASEKAGIIKNNSFTIIADNGIELMNAVSKQTNNYVNVLKKYSYTVNLDFNNFTNQLNFNDRTYSLSMLGDFQALNFLCAYETFNYLKISQSAINYSALNSKIRGRLEVTGYAPLTIIDAAHNESGVRELVKSIQGIFKPSEVVIIIAILKDKNINQMLELLKNLTNTIIYTNIPDNPRSIEAVELAQIGCKKFIRQHVCENIGSAIKLAKTMNKKLVLVTGSIYLLSHVL